MSVSNILFSYVPLESCPLEGDLRLMFLLALFKGITPVFCSELAL
jgi:hypothetical protein